MTKPTKRLLHKHFNQATAQLHFHVLSICTYYNVPLSL